MNFQITKVQISPYHLKLKSVANKMTSQLKQEGCLLKVDFLDEAGMVSGYSGLQAWPSLGDEPLNVQIDKLKKRELTPLTRQALKNAYWQSQYQQVEADKAVIKNHFQYQGALKDYNELSLVEQGFCAVKIKLSAEEKNEWSELRSIFLQTQLKWRLDFNEGFSSVDAFKEFLNFLGEEAILSLEFIEDPFGYSREEWRDIQQEYAVDLALDRETYKYIDQSVSARVVVIKPALCDWQSILAQNKSKGLCRDTLKQRVLVTHYMDHPLGQWQAFHCARQLSAYGDLLDCGLLPLPSECFPPFSFLTAQGNQMRPLTHESQWLSQLSQLDWQDLVLAKEGEIEFV